MDQIGWFIATIHQMLGHDTGAAWMGVPAGNKDDCLICQYERHPTDITRQAVVDALAAPPAGEEAS